MTTSRPALAGDAMRHHDHDSEDIAWELRHRFDDEDGRLIRRRYRCSDGMCGALDCDRCHPGWDEDTDEEDPDA